MSQVKADPHGAGYVYQPTHAVTALYPSSVNVLGIQQALAGAGFNADQIQVFQGQAGAAQLDLKGDRHGAWVHLFRRLGRVFTDDAMIFDRMEQVLQSGGAAVAAFTGGDDAQKARAVEVLKAHGGKEVWYWGDLVTEGL